MPPPPRSGYRAFPMPQMAPACFLSEATSILTSNTLFAHYIDEETEAQQCEVTCPKSQSCKQHYLCFWRERVFGDLEGGCKCFGTQCHPQRMYRVLHPPLAATFTQGTLLPPLAEAASSLVPPTCPRWCQGALPCLKCPPGRTEPCPILKGLSLKAFT